MHRSKVLPFLAIAGLLASLAAPVWSDDDEGAPTSPDRVLRPFLWRIEGDTPNFLFGTAHVLDPRVTTLHPSVQEAFDGAGAAFFEIDFIQDAAAQIRILSLPEETKLEDVLSKDVLKRLDARLLKISPMLAREALPPMLKNLKPLGWSLMLPQLAEQMKKPGQPVLDAKLYREAMAAGKTKGGLENPVEQLAFMDDLTTDEAVEALRMTLDFFDDADASGDDPLAVLLDPYLRGDAKELLGAAEKMMSEGLPQDLKERMLEGFLYGRNERQARAIAAQIKAHPERKHFFAVGAMHLIGPRSVQEHLAKLGLKTTRVEPSEVAASPPKERPEPVPAGEGK